jgi:hypothetical protein
MRHLRPGSSLIAVAILLAACGSGAGPGSGSTPGTQATQGGGGETPGTGGGGGIDTANGKAHVDFTGPNPKTDDLGFVPLASHFGGTDETILTFSNPGSSSALSVTWTAGQVAASYTSLDLTVTGTDCTGSSNVQGSSASGSFDCTTVIVILKSGATSQEGELKGTFDAHG